MIAVLALLLGACSSLPNTPLPTSSRNQGDFSISSRISARTTEQSFAGMMTWQHTRTEDEVLLSSPLGQGVARILSTPNGATIENAQGEQRSAPDAESLTAALLGWRMPLSHLSDWLNDSSSSDEQLHEGWRIRYIQRDDQHRPTALDLSYGDVEIRLRAIRWETPAKQVTSPTVPVPVTP